MAPVSQNPQLAGLATVLNRKEGTAGAVLEDMRAAQEQDNEDVSSGDNDLSDDEDEDDEDAPKPSESVERGTLLDTVHANSKGVKASTDETYRRSMLFYFSRNVALTKMLNIK